MGKQIRFLLDEDTEKRFIEYVMGDQKCDVLSEKESGGCYSINETSELLNSNEFQFFFYRKVFGNLEYEITKNGILYYNQIITPLIEYSRTSIEVSPEKEIISGRLWVEMRYYDDDGNYVIKDESLDECYKQLTKWIKRNAKRRTVTFPNGHVETGYMTDSMQALIEGGDYLVLGL